MISFGTADKDRQEDSWEEDSLPSRSEAEAEAEAEGGNIPKLSPENMEAEMKA